MTFHKFYYEQYLPAHANRTCRLLHALGPFASAAFGGAVAWLALGGRPGLWWLLLALPAPAFLMAWLGHLVAHNHPTFFTHPLLSVAAYFKLLSSMAMGKA